MTSGRILRPFGVAAVEAPTALQAAEFDRRVISVEGVPEPALMENAGREAALLIQHLYPEGPVVAAVGAGNNGGDALVCLRALAAWGRDVKAVLVADRGHDLAEGSQPLLAYQLGLGRAQLGRALLDALLQLLVERMHRRFGTLAFADVAHHDHHQLTSVNRDP